MLIPTPVSPPTTPTWLQQPPHDSDFPPKGCQTSQIHYVLYALIDLIETENVMFHSGALLIGLRSVTSLVKQLQGRAATLHPPWQQSVASGEAAQSYTDTQRERERERERVKERKKESVLMGFWVMVYDTLLRHLWYMCGNGGITLKLVNYDWWC